jgi:hypothetical protein
MNNTATAEVDFRHPSLLLTEEEANGIAEIYYPASPNGIGAPYVDAFGAVIGHRKALAIYRDPFDRGVWLIVDHAHEVPLRARGVAAS